MTTVYVIGSLRNPRVPVIGNVLRDAGYDAFDDWYAGGRHADDEWMAYEQGRGRTYREALAAYNAQHIFHYDLYHLNRADAAVLVMPAGRSAFNELCYMRWERKKPGWVLMEDDPERWDVMLAFHPVCWGVEELLATMETPQWIYPSPGDLQADAQVEQQVKEYRRAPWNADL